MQGKSSAQSGSTADCPSINVQPGTFVQKRLGNFNQLLQDYELVGKKLGEGFFGSVEIVQLKGTKEQRAMKKIDKQLFKGDLNREFLQREISILKSLDHPNILKIYEFYEDKRYMYIITEICQGKDLFDEMMNRPSGETFSEQETMKIIQQALSALQYSHSLFIAHRDIKPDNIMIQLDTSKIKIIDWGTSILCKGQKIKTLVGSSFYIAPEILKKRGYDEKVDLWSLGILMYNLLCGDPPFSSGDTQIVLKEIVSKNITYDEAIWSKFSKECRDLNECLLTFAPWKRISASKALEHPWFKIAEPSKVRTKLLNDKLQALKTFKYQSKLQMATIQYVASHLMSQSEKDELSDLFVHLDTNKDGRLSRSEIISGYSKLHGQEEAEQIVEKIFSQVDVDKSGMIDYNEFLASTMNMNKLMNQQNLKRAFSLFDVDGDEKITATEIKAVLKNNEDQFDSQIWRGMVSEVDKDGNGSIDFVEFCSMMDTVVQDKMPIIKNLAPIDSSDDILLSRLTPFQIVTRSKSKPSDQVDQENVPTNSNINTNSNLLSVPQQNREKSHSRSKTPTRQNTLSVPDGSKSPILAMSPSPSRKERARERKEVFSSIEDQVDSHETSPRKIFKKK